MKQTDRTRSEAGRKLIGQHGGKRNYASQRVANCSVRPVFIFENMSNNSILEPDLPIASFKFLMLDIKP